MLFGGCAVVLVVASSGDSDYEPRSPAEERELEQAERTVEATCSLWWAGALNLPDHQAQVCADGNYGK